MRAKRQESRVELPRWRRVARRVLIFGLVLGGVGLVVVGWAYRSATAQLDQTLTELGTQMMVYEHATHQDMPRQLVVNGQTLHLSSGTAARSLTDVLDYFEARCAEADGELTLQMQRLVSDHPEVGGDVPDAPTIRRDDGRSGYVACIDLGDESIDVNELVLRLGRFGSTGDVSEIGDARYVFAEQDLIDGEISTHFVAMWTEGELNVRRMFPESGDAPGRDVEGVSRPPRARRILHGAERGMPQSLTVYATHEDVSALETFYREDLAQNGWTLIAQGGAARPANAPSTLIAERGGRMVTVMFQPDPAGDGSTAAIFDAP